MKWFAHGHLDGVRECYVRAHLDRTAPKVGRSLLFYDDRLIMIYNAIFIVQKWQAKHGKMQNY